MTIILAVNSPAVELTRHPEPSLTIALTRAFVSTCAPRPFASRAKPCTRRSVSTSSAWAAPARKASQPAAADAPPDDLKRIKGIGPKLSEWLHENGVTRYAQIAEWDRAAIADYAERLGRMGGRIEADDWVGQAKLLAAGGEIEFSHRVDDGEVY